MAPGKPTKKSFAELVNIVKNHLNPRPSSIVYRFKFNCRFRKQGETIQQYVAELRSLSEHCDFREQLEEMLRDCLVCGVNDERKQRRLLAESRLDFKKALELATAMEIADKNTRDIQQGNSVEKPKEQPVNRLSKQQGKHAAKDCYRYGGKFHEAEKCRYKDEKCYRCHKKGHKAIKYRANPKTNQRNGQNRGNTHHMEATDSEEEEDENEEDYTMFRVVAEGKEPYRVVIDLNGISTSMEVDTGAAATIISEETFKEINKRSSAKKKLEMKPAHVKLRTYTGELVKVLGTVYGVVKYEGQENELSTLVVQGSGPSLFGRDGLKEVKLDWKKLFKMNMDEKHVESRLEN